MSKYNLQLTRLDSTLNSPEGLMDIEASLLKAQKIINELNTNIDALEAGLTALTVRVQTLEDA